MPDNLHLWRQVEETAPGYTKKSNFDGRDVTSINGTYMVKRATEIAGPIGDRWGYEIIEDRFDQGGPIFFKDQLVGNAQMHTIVIELWYLNISNKRCTVRHFGHTPYVFQTLNGIKTDFDAPKKSLTDALKKCLSMFGFSADVYLGMHDDPNYVASMKTKEDIEKADNHEAETLAKKTELGKWVERELQSYAKVPNQSTVKLIHRNHIKKLERECHVLGIDFHRARVKFDDALNARLKELLPTIDLVCEDCGVLSKGQEGSKCADCGGNTAPQGA
jgi:hypothetical protein